MNDIAKLPRWAQDHIADLQRQRDTAVHELKEWTDSQTPSPISISEYICDGEKQGPSSYTRYIQGTDVKFDWQGVTLTVALRKAGNMHENAINLQWSGDRQIGGTQVAFVPTSFQSASLIAKENMR